MSLQGRARAYITATVVAGVVAFALVSVIDAHEGVGPLPVFLTFAALLAVNWSHPLLLVAREEAESVNLDEAFLVAMLLVLSPFGILAAYALGTLIGSIARRRPATKTAFNVGQQIVSATAAAGVAHGLIGLGDEIGPRMIAAAAAGAATYLIVNSSAVSMVIALTEGESFRRIWVRGARPRALATLGGACLGLLAGIAASAYGWALLFAAVPLVMLYVVSAGQVRAQRDRERMLGLFQIAVEAHASMERGGVEHAIAASAREFLRARTSAVGSAPPREGQLGARLSDPGSAERWLVVSEPRGAASFEAADEALLQAIAAIAKPALDNAALFEQVAVERRRANDVIASSSDGILSVDGDQRIQSWNPAMERITGFAAADVIGAKCFTVFRPRDESGNDLCVAYCPGRCGRTSEAVPVQITTLDGQVRWLTCTYSPMPDGGYVVVARDITAQKQVDDLKADFLATVSHELRTPLTPIQGFLHTLLREDVAFDDDQRKRFYEVMLRQSERLERLVKDLLDATSLQEQDQLFLPEEVDWAHAVDRVVDLFRAQEPNREFVLEVDDHLPHVVADEQRAEQVLNNLLTNAVKYSGPTDPVRIIVERRGDGVATTVVDRGPGVPPADRDRIFERFTRLGDHLTRKVGGAGLGLFIAKRLVEAMGGEIGVTSGADGGAAFYFTLPQYEGANNRI